MLNKEGGGILHRKENKAVILYSILVNLYTMVDHASMVAIIIGSILSKYSM